MRREGTPAASQLGLGEAVCLVAGAGIGGGVMAVPYLAAQAGFWPSLAIMGIAYLVTVVLHIMVAELSVRTGYASELLTVFTTHLFGRRPWLRGGFFVLMAVTLTCNLAAYVTGAGDILAELVGFPGLAAKALFFIAAAVVVALGLKRVALNEVAWLLVMLALLALLVVRTARLPAPEPLAPAHWAASPLLAVYGMAMFSLSSLFAVPQAAAGLRGAADADAAGARRRLVSAVGLGLGVNLVIMVAITACALSASSPVTEVAIIGWAGALGGATHGLGSAFIVSAMLTTFWSISLQLSDMTRAFLRSGRLVAWLVATMPAFGLTLLPLTGFLALMQFAGGATAVVVALMVVPAYANAVRGRGGLLLGRSGNRRGVYATVITMYVAMAVASFV